MKLFEQLFLIIENRKLIPIHHFAFQYKHAITEQIHRTVKKMNNDIEADGYCTVVFLDISPSVWYGGLLYRIKNSFPIDLYAVIKSYLLHGTFRVKYGEVIT